VANLLPTTMVGSYPRPLWYRNQLGGRDMLEALKREEHLQACQDATTAVIQDQESVGLDVVTDGQMHYDDYGGAIGSFAWYWYERIGGFDPSKQASPLAEGNGGVSETWARLMENWGGTQVLERVYRRTASRLPDMYRYAASVARRPVKVSLGAGPPNLALHVHYDAPGSANASKQALAEDLAPIFNRELKEIVAAGANYVQLEDLGGWSLAPGDPDAEWIMNVMNTWVDGVDAKLAWHCCLGTDYGNAAREFFDALPSVIDNMYRVNVDSSCLTSRCEM
jgi:methionine synthase II (cobalamin-independent)